MQHGISGCDYKFIFPPKAYIWPIPGPEAVWNKGTHTNSFLWQLQRDCKEGDSGTQAHTSLIPSDTGDWE